ncbi:hypothetical protein AYO38_05315 [bacterium SCGC AG-212-C10]|nr:hypothetical protein AYO38_05315 [bacterium SCGC AG-212-C10]
MTGLIGGLAIMAGGVVLAHGSAFTTLSALALKRPGPLSPATKPWRLVIIVPAHDEEQGIGRCLDSLKAAARDCAEILVVADNCSDGTADAARACGVTVLERSDRERRGKSFALAYALDTLAAREEKPDAVVFVDADTIVDEELLEVLSSRLDAGADSVQVHYRGDSGEAPLTRLRRLAFLLIHYARPLGAERLGLGTGLKGNGMALTWAVARSGAEGHGITEDAALTLALARRGIRVAYEPRTWVEGYMAAGYDAARTQDDRWERGRLSLMAEALRAFGAAAARGDLPTAWAALDVASLPLSLLVLLSAASVGAGALAGSATVPLLGAASIVSYVAVGLVAARAPLADVAALTSAPRFLAHKLGVYANVLRRPGSGAWQRTSREH